MNGQPTSHACSAEQFQCSNGQCIAIARQCDGATDCTDASDENEHCPQSMSSFHCHIIKLEMLQAQQNNKSLLANCQTFNNSKISNTGGFHFKQFMKTIEAVDDYNIMVILSELCWVKSQIIPCLSTYRVFNVIFLSMCYSFYV